MAPDRKNSSFSLTLVLYEWLHEKRLITAVALEMGVNASALSAKLRPSNTKALLGVDELAPLLQAIRNIGYGSELEGILHRFIGSLRGSAQVESNETDMLPQVLALARGLGILLDCASRVPTTCDEAELTRLCTMLRTEILPVVLKMEAMLSTRIKQIRRTQNS